MSSPQLCNLMVEQSDLKKLQDLDPFQIQGFQSSGKISVPVNIVYTDQLNKSTSDIQPLTFQILTRWARNPQKLKDQPTLESLRVVITSEEDIFLAFVSNCSIQTFESFRQKNQLNIQFNDFPSTLLKFLSASNNQQTKTQIEMKLTHQGIGRLKISQDTHYKKLQLVQLYLQSCNVEKTHQSIIYRYNFSRTKLAMLENSIETVYKILAQKNPPLLHYIQKNVGVEE